MSAILGNKFDRYIRGNCVTKTDFNFSDTRTTLKKELLFKALMVCVKQQSLNDIQIATLCREAKVSRMFYYRHFTSKEGIITDKFQREYQQYLRIIRKYKIHDPHQMAFEFFEFFRGFRDTTQELIDADLGYLVDYNFRDYFKDMLANHVIHGNQQYPDYWIAFAVGGLSQLLFSWIQKGTPESSTEMANIFFSFTEPIQD